MPTLTITKTYANDTVLTEDQLDDIKNSVETFLNITKLGSDNIQSNSIGTDQLASTAVSTPKLANGAVTDSKLANSPGDDSIRAVTTNSIKDSAVTTAKIADANITLAKLATTIVNALIPTGTVHAYGAEGSPPAGFLNCNGDAVSRTTYATLFSIIGANFGQGDNSTTFNLPDLRGYFIRGTAGGTGRDPDVASRTALVTGGQAGDHIGSVQPSAFQTHNHSITNNIVQAAVSNSIVINANIGGGGGNGYIGDATNGSTIVNFTPATVTNSTGGNESRPLNVYMNYIIKY